MRLLPRSLAGRLIAYLLLALIVAQAVAVALIVLERREAIRSVNEEQVLTRTATLLQVVSEVPSAQQEGLLIAASSRRQVFSITANHALGDAAMSTAEQRLAARFATLLPPPPPQILIRAGGEAWGGHRRWRAYEDHDDDGEDEDDDDWEERRERWHDGRRGYRHWRGPAWLQVSVKLDDGRWLNARAGPPPRPPRWAFSSLYLLGAMAVAVVLVVVLVVRRVARPMNRLAAAADGLGRGESPGPLPEEGPEEVRRTIQAFNRMQERLERFVADRTRLLAAISHDLRTPITSLRLRAEFVEDDEVREKILETLDEMQRMAEETLAFAREEAAREDTQSVDLAALLDSLSADLADLGHEVAFQEAPRCPLPCRPVALKRALRNLIENAVRHGSRARIRLEAEGSQVRIEIDDDGPGIPEEDFERVFEPFVRLEESRSRETGGAGLGLAIARSIVRAHGGDIALANRPQGGLRVTVSLPKT